MSNQRAEGQKLLTVPVKEAFLDCLDANLERCDYSNRSQFVRDAILEKLQEEGIAMPRHLAMAMARTEQAKPVRYKISSKSGDRARVAAKRAADSERRGDPRPKQ